MEPLPKQVVTALLNDDRTRRQIRRVQETVGQMSKHNNSVSCFNEVYAVKTSHGYHDIVEFSYPGAPCFAALPNAGDYEATPIAVVAGVMTPAFKEVSGSVLRDFFLWAENESPFKDAVYDHSINIASGKGTIVVRGDKDARLVVGALIAVRCAHEYPDIVCRWDKLQKLGFNRTASFLFAHFLDVVDDKLVMGKVHCSHVSLNVSGMHGEVVKGFLTGEIAKTKKENLLYFEKVARYDGVHDLWGEWGGEETIIQIANKLSKKGVDKGKSMWGGKKEDRPFCPLEMCNIMGLDATTVLVPRFLEALKEGGAVQAVKKDVKKDKPLSARTLREHALQRHLRVLGQEGECVCVSCVKGHRMTWLRNNPLRDFEETRTEEAPPVPDEPEIINLEPGGLDLGRAFTYPFAGAIIQNDARIDPTLNPMEEANNRLLQRRNYLDVMDNNNLGMWRAK